MNQNIIGSGSEHDQCSSEKCIVWEQDQFMPIANVIRIMRKKLPSHAKIADEAKVTIQECVSEFISFITGEANDRCEREHRKTITGEDVIYAMSKLGFDSYIDPISLFHRRYRQMELGIDYVPPKRTSSAPAFGGAYAHHMYHSPPGRAGHYAQYPSRFEHGRADTHTKG